MLPHSLAENPNLKGASHEKLSVFMLSFLVCWLFACFFAIATFLGWWEAERKKNFERKLVRYYNFLALCKAKQYVKSSPQVGIMGYYISEGNWCCIKIQANFVESEKVVASEFITQSNHGKHLPRNLFKPTFKKCIRWSLRVSSHRTGRVDYTNYYNHNSLSIYHFTQHIGDFSCEENTTSSRQAKHLVRGSNMCLSRIIYHNIKNINIWALAPFVPIPRAPKNHTEPP